MPDELMMHAHRWQPHLRQHVLAVKADCKVMSGDYVENLATYTEVGRHDQALIHLRVAAHFARVQAASLTVDTAQAAELGYAWLER